MNKKPSILIVDDDPKLRKTLTDILGVKGTVFKTKTGEIKPLCLMQLKDWSEEALTEFGALTQSVVRLLKRVSENSKKPKK